ncbi:MAG: outer membrane protein transport protein [Bacteroidales bacterium]|jgi:hypothetical protein|nr:outer membrane protein transport protein [Bacteroidales bacterium]
MKKLLKKILFSIGFLSLLQISIFTQNEIDALRFSELDWQGSARFMGAGRAFGAVGAEFSALNVNPAAIGLYKKSEVTFTPLTVSVYKNTTGYNETGTSAQAVKYNLGSAGIVLTIPGISSTLWKKFQLGFGFNRIKNFNNTFSVEGRSKGSTIGSVFALEANGLNYEDVDYWGSDEAWIAWNSYFINPESDSKTSYVPALLGKDLAQSSSVSRAGGIDEMIFSVGTNYDDKLFLGATIGVPFINFSEKRFFLEVDDHPSPTDTFRSIKLTDKLTVRSTGIIFKIGAIYQPFNFLRFGFAFHTPTYYGNIKDNFDRKMFAQTKTDDLSVNYVNSYNYSLTTPLRATANVAFLIAQRAFISAEYEFVDYSMASMSSVDYNFNKENNAIQNKYGFSHIARIGLELNLSQVFSIRAGYNYISSPYKNNINDGSQHYASAGLGFRTKFLYGDFAYAFNTSKEKYWMYEPEFVNVVNNKFVTHRILLTLGIRF